MKHESEQSCSQLAKSQIRSAGSRDSFRACRRKAGLLPGALIRTSREHTTGKGDEGGKTNAFIYLAPDVGVLLMCCLPRKMNYVLLLFVFGSAFPDVGVCVCVHVLSKDRQDESGEQKNGRKE